MSDRIFISCIWVTILLIFCGGFTYRIRMVNAEVAEIVELLEEQAALINSQARLLDNQAGLIDDLSVALGCYIQLDKCSDEEVLVEAEK